MPEPEETVLRVAGRRPVADEWALVLVSQGFAPRIRRERGRFALGVPAVQAERAAQALAAWERENASAEDAPPPAPVHADAGAGVVAVAALVSFFFVTRALAASVPWVGRGAAEAERILAGEAWRVVTALTLHADLGHVASNALAGGFFFTAVCRLFGPGVGLLAVLLAGAGGNALNAWVQGPPHASVGASTAVFGAVGLLAGTAAVRRRRAGARGRRALVPVAAGLALLAMLGTSERTDVFAHLFGFAVGAPLGVAVGLTTRRPLPGAVQPLGVAACLALVAACWWRALA